MLFSVFFYDFICEFVFDFVADFILGAQIMMCPKLVHHCQNQPKILNVILQRKSSYQKNSTEDVAWKLIPTLLFL